MSQDPNRFREMLARAKSARATEEPDAPPAPGPSPALSVRKPIGRPKGKKSDPAFAQVTAYVPADLHRRVKIALLQAGKGQEFSELVAELLEGWIAKQPKV